MWIFLSLFRSITHLDLPSRWVLGRRVTRVFANVGRNDVWGFVHWVISMTLFLQFHRDYRIIPNCKIVVSNHGATDLCKTCDIFVKIKIIVHWSRITHFDSVWNILVSLSTTCFHAVLQIFSSLSIPKRQSYNLCYCLFSSDIK